MLSMSENGDFKLTIDSSQLVKGLRPSKRSPRNSGFLIESKGAVGLDGVLQAVEQLTRLDTSAVSSAFPFPQIFVFTNVIIVCFQTAIYEWNGSALVSKLAEVKAGGPWSAADFFDYVYLSNGRKAVVRDASSKTYFVAGMLTSATLAIGSTNTAVASIAFTYFIDGVTCSKVAVATGTAPGNDVIPEDKYGAVAFDIGVDGTIDAVEASTNSTGYTTAALAIDGLPAVATDHVRMGTVTAMKSDGAFTFGTTALNATNSTVAYTSTPICSILPAATAICNFNGQVLIGGPDVDYDVVTLVESVKDLYTTVTVHGSVLVGKVLSGTLNVSVAVRGD